MLDDLARKNKWAELFRLVEENEFTVTINDTQLRDKNSPAKLYTPLHYAVRGKASKDVIQELLRLGASKCLKTADGETAYDIGVRVGLNADILNIIEVPKDIRESENEIQKMEAALHKVILGRVEDLINMHGQILPQLAFLYEFETFWYKIAGWYGGFTVTKHEQGMTVVSLCRVFGGSGQKHVIDKEGNVELVDEAFDC